VPGPGDESDGGRAMPAIGERTRTTGSVLAGLACLGAASAVAGYLHRYGLGGLAVDREALRGWLSGNGLYAYRSGVSSLGTAQPPVAAMLLLPSAVLPLPLTGWLLGLAGVAALILALIALAGPVARRYAKPRWAAVLVAGALAMLAEPVRATIGYGRLDLLLFGLLTADVVALRRGAWARSRAAWWPGPPASQPARGRHPADLLRRAWATGAWAGVGTGIATALAVSPVLFIGYLALTRQWRATLTSLGTTAALVISGLLIAPATTAAWFGTALLQVDRSGPVGLPVNQSLAGVLARLYGSATIPVLIWLSFAGLLVAMGLIRARSAHADGDEIAAFTLVGLTSAAIGPVTHTHELIWVLPAVLILVDAAARRRATRKPGAGRRFPGPGRRFPGLGHAAAAIVVYLLCAAPSGWTVGWDADALALIVLLNALPWRPGVAPAFPINRWPRPVSRTPAIPGPRAHPAEHGGARRETDPTGS
jgi:alpha-1,2-mannosyltransferase